MMKIIFQLNQFKGSDFCSIFDHWILELLSLKGLKERRKGLKREEINKDKALISSWEESHPFQNVQVPVHFSPLPPIPNKQMELHRDSDQPSLMKLTTILHFVFS